MTLDFGKEVGGFTRLHVAPGSAAPNVALTYSEWSTYATPDQQRRVQRREQQRAAGDLPRARGRRRSTPARRSPRRRAGAVADRRELDLGDRRARTTSAPASTVYLRKTFTVADPSALASRDAARQRRRQRGDLRQRRRRSPSMGNSFQTSAIADVKSAARGRARTWSRSGRPTPRSARRARWRSSSSAPRRSSPTRPGRRATTEQAGWNTAGFDDSAWSNAFANGAYGAGPWGTFADPDTSGAGTDSRTTLTAATPRRATRRSASPARRYLSAGTKLDVGGETARVASVAGHDGHARRAPLALAARRRRQRVAGQQRAARRLPLPDDLQPRPGHAGARRRRGGHHVRAEHEPTCAPTRTTSTPTTR